MNIEAQKKTKIFVLDTNVLLHDPESLMNFGCNDVYLTMGVIGELDKLKSAAGELGNNARQVIRTLDALREKGTLKDGVATPKGGFVRVFLPEILDNVPSNDNSVARQVKDFNNSVIKMAYLLSVVYHLKVVLVTKDISTRIMADALGIVVEDYETGYL